MILDRVGSTQETVKEAAANGADEGLAILALSQDSGRGRSGRKWISPAGKNLALSILLRPKISPRLAPLLGLMTSIAVAEVFTALGVKNPRLKWPNDVLVQERKIAGILPEASLGYNTIEYVIMGIGANINTELDDFPQELRALVTSALIETGRAHDLAKTAVGLLTKMENLYNRIDSEGCGFIAPLWEKHWGHKGKLIKVGAKTGIAHAIDNDGALLLKDGDLIHKITAGEVQLVGII